jgi:hypothetical protein
MGLVPTRCLSNRPSSHVGGWTYTAGWDRVGVPVGPCGAIAVRRSAPVLTYAGGGNEDEDQHQSYPDDARR